MKRLHLLLVALATLSFVAFYSCQNTGKTEEKAVEETEEVVQEEVVEEEMVADSTAMEEEVVAEEAETEGEAQEHGEGR